MVQLVKPRDRLKIKTGGTDEPTAVQPQFNQTVIQPGSNQSENWPNQTVELAAWFMTHCQQQVQSAKESWFKVSI
jgi:hypothetical protein